MCVCGGGWLTCQPFLVSGINLTQEKIIIHHRNSELLMHSSNGFLVFYLHQMQFRILSIISSCSFWAWFRITSGSCVCSSNKMIKSSCCNKVSLPMLNVDFCLYRLHRSCTSGYTSCFRLASIVCARTRSSVEEKCEILPTELYVTTHLSQWLLTRH